MNRITCVLLLGLGLICAESKASLVFTLGNASDALSAVDVDTPLGPFMAGDTISVPVFAHVDGLTPNALTTYEIPIDLGGDGQVIPSGGGGPFFSGFPIGNSGSGGPVSAVGGNLTFSTAFPMASEFDFIAEWNGAAMLSSDPANPTLLFVLNFASNLATPDGVFDVVIPMGPISDQFTNANSGATPITDFVFDDGQFEIQSIPEPSAFVATASLWLLSTARRRRAR